MYWIIESPTGPFVAKANEFCPLTKTELFQFNADGPYSKYRQAADAYQARLKQSKSNPK